MNTKFVTGKLKIRKWHTDAQLPTKITDKINN